MRAFTSHRGVLVPIRRSNIDTDTIIPSREMKRVSRTGLSEGLFAGWRYLPDRGREPNPEFVLNQPEFKGSSILAAGSNFGCGSSREHAVWSLQEYGIRAILAPSFGSIFERNCVNNGLLPVRLPRQELVALVDHVSSDPQSQVVTVDLENNQVSAADLAPIAFTIGELQRDMLLNGWDPIDLTMQLDQDINKFETSDRAKRPWAYDLDARRGLV